MGTATGLLEKKLRRGGAARGVDEALVDGLVRWVCNGILPGSFLRAVLRNDLREAVGRADADNLNDLAKIVGLAYNYLPSASWGSREICLTWKERINQRK